MIIGNGLIARACQRIDHRGLVIYASGVSDSTEKRKSEFERERDMLASVHGRIIYFSTICPIDNSYVLHKRQMEAMLKPEDLILRLGCVVGNGGNRTNLFNIMEKRLATGQVIPISKDAVRGFIDVDDLVDVVDSVKNKSGILSVPGAVSAKVWDVVLLMAYHMKVKANIEIKEPDKWMWEWDVEYDNDYIEELIKKYNGYSNNDIATGASNP